VAIRHDICFLRPPVSNDGFNMPRGPKGEKRPADAIMIAKIATGEIEDITTEDGKNAAAVALGRMGGKARAEGMTAKRRKEIAKKAAKARWSED
jgi:hypothetical protein